MNQHLSNRPTGPWGGAMLAAGLVAACAAADAPVAQAAAVDTQALYRQIRDEVGDARCSANDQCRSSPLGHKACGGPEAYLVWSTAASNEKRLTDLLGQYNAARQVESKQPGRVSDCSMVQDPGARCEASRCVPAGRMPAVM